MAWTDERLDDFAGRLSADMRELRTEIRELRTDIRESRAELSGEITAVRTELRDEIAELRLFTMRIGGGMLIAQFGMIAALIARG